VKHFFYVLTAPIVLLFVVAANDAIVETADLSPSRQAEAVVRRGVTAHPALQAGAAQTAAQSAAPQQPATAPGPAATYVGADTCLGCHDDALRAKEPGAQGGLEQTIHWKAAHPRSPAAAQGCESCHGPGSKHVADPANDTFIRKFTKMAPRDGLERGSLNPSEANDGGPA